MKDKYKTDVQFLVYKDDTEIFAYFPNEKYFGDDTAVARDYGFDLRMRTCYAHIGQHSACHPDYASECIEAPPEAYSDLKNELESIGYDLNVLNNGIS